MTVSLLSGTALFALTGLPALAQEDFPDPSPDADVVVIDQVQLSDVFANMNVVVIGNAEGADAVATATGNTTSANSHNNDLDFDAVQQQDGSVTAISTISGGTVYGAPARTVTTAYGNAASSSTTNGTDFSMVTQTSNADVGAYSDIELDGADDVSAITTATANVNSYSTENGTNRGFQTQTGNADVTAVTEANLYYNGNSASIGSTATGNSVSSYGSTTTSFNGAVQVMDFDTRVSAYTDTYIGTANNVAVSATAAANNVKVENEWGYATLGREPSEVYQGNGADVQAEASLTLTDWNGSSGSTAYGVGNSALISNVGSDTALYANQENFGNVDSAAYFSGGNTDGSVGYASATSIGNAATATLCYSCGQDNVLFGRTNQTNYSNTTASAYVEGGNGGYLSGAATAVGNSATYHSINSND
tara:strand:- start:1425 stop:2687 length:1263 start_codon:yes stop_codon:yes gene_type:complete